MRIIHAHKYFYKRRGAEHYMLDLMNMQGNIQKIFPVLGMDFLSLRFKLNREVEICIKH
ncbi:MAG: hypothetical protein UU63_C0033G0004 [Candidatus Uhrbacteria bacterium GW2011_GWF2_41_430]|nr:MAG: hypothetical protein UU63_C0033G0004 [Candidatus Uhrbacteria bacterium GW2011_GWF2_41_430]